MRARDCGRRVCDVADPAVDTMLLVQASAPSRLYPVRGQPQRRWQRAFARHAARTDQDSERERLRAAVRRRRRGGETFFSAGPSGIGYGPAVLRSRDGEAFVLASVTHPQGRPPSISGWLVASHAGVHVRGRRASLADVEGISGSLPSLDTTLDGAAFVDGRAELPAVGVDARATHLVVSGVDLGDATLLAFGHDGHVHIAQATLRGASIVAAAHGDMLVSPRLTVRAAALTGSGTADLAAFAPLFPQARPRGRASGRLQRGARGVGLRAHAPRSQRRCEHRRYRRA